MALSCFYFIFLISLKLATCQKVCPVYRCSEAGHEPDIVYPFGIKEHQEIGCGYPGFNLTCNILDRTVLKLPQSGEYLVRKIDYANKEVRLYDQNNCLARRLQQQSLNVNLLPFKAYAYQIYNFFNCPKSITSNSSAVAITKVPCLSDSTNTVLVAVSSSSEVDGNIAKVLISGGCEILAPVTVPIPFSAVNKVSSYDFSTEDLYLTWNEPKNIPAPENKRNGGSFFQISGKKNEAGENTLLNTILIIAAVVLGV